ncbi:MAG: dephospho-CoA kinase [Phaeodactylibacter sp.]|nr:dephospho-CoA kinase [Phaeodactylibacter sp.]
MLKIGLTGGIGSGKTTVARIFQVLGIPVYFADDRAKLLMLNKPEIVNGVKAIFGVNAYAEDGSLNRSHIAAIAFNDPHKLLQLESIVHPAVQKDGDQWHRAQSGVPYTLKEAALLFESGSYKFLDEVITVTAPQELRIERVMQRDGASREQVLARLEKQWPEEEKVRYSNYQIRNDGSRSLIQQVLDVHHLILEKI